MPCDSSTMPGGLLVKYGVEGVWRQIVDMDWNRRIWVETIKITLRPSPYMPKIGSTFIDVTEPVLVWSTDYVATNGRTQNTSSCQQQRIYNQFHAEFCQIRLAQKCSNCFRWAACRQGWLKANPDPQKLFDLWIASFECQATKPVYGAVRSKRGIAELSKARLDVRKLAFRA